MDFIDILLKRMDGGSELKRPIHALISFSKPATGEALVLLANDLVKSHTQKPSITALNLVDEVQAQEIENMEEYKTNLFSKIITSVDQSKITIRTFLKVSHNFTDDILKTAEEQKCNLILLGIGSNVLNPALWDKYCKLKRESETPDNILSQFKPHEAKSLQNVSNILSRNPDASGVFINNNYKDAHNVFVPILDKEDVHIFTYIYQIANKNSQVSVTIWDAIGITEANNPKVQKLFQYIAKKTDNRVKRWDRDKKIDESFIATQDLIVIGIEAWEKLISAPLSWTASLPSTLIIKDKAE